MLVVFCFISTTKLGIHVAIEFRCFFFEFVLLLTLYGSFPIDLERHKGWRIVGNILLANCLIVLFISSPSGSISLNYISDRVEADSGERGQLLHGHIMVLVVVDDVDPLCVSDLLVRQRIPTHFTLGQPSIL